MWSIALSAAVVLPLLPLVFAGPIGESATGSADSCVQLLESVLEPFGLAAACVAAIAAGWR
jgi:hypothetical protein